MSRDGRCGEVKGCCRFLCHSAPSDTGPGKTLGSLRRFGCSKVTTWQRSSVDLRRVWVSGEVAKSEAFWHEPQWLSRTITRQVPPTPTTPRQAYTQTHRMHSDSTVLCTLFFSFFFFLFCAAAFRVFSPQPQVSCRPLFSPVGFTLVKKRFAGTWLREFHGY